MEPPVIIVEFFGIPRQRAGCAAVAVRAQTFADVLAAVEQHCPRLQGLQRSDGSLSGQYLLSVDGERFVTDLNETVEPGVRLLLLSADVGG